MISMLTFMSPMYMVTMFLLQSSLTTVIEAGGREERSLISLIIMKVDRSNFPGQWDVSVTTVISVPTSLPSNPSFPQPFHSTVVQSSTKT